VLHQHFYGVENSLQRFQPVENVLKKSLPALQTVFNGVEKFL